MDKRKAPPVSASLPELPYAGTSGWSGSEASRERAEHADETGLTSQRQRDTLRAVAWSREAGMTWRELSNLTGWHHGVASSVLSVLHRTGHLARLQERRFRCSVYILPEYVNERLTSAYTPNKRALTEREEKVVQALERAVETTIPGLQIGVKPKVLAEIVGIIRRLST